jgi:hypothetical protein
MRRLDSSPAPRYFFCMRRFVPLSFSTGAVFRAAVLGALFCLSSCAAGGWSDTVVTNGSSQTVIFKFRHTVEYTLAPNGSVSFPGEAYQTLEYYKSDKRVYVEYHSSGTYTFKDRIPHQARFISELGADITAQVRAGGWLNPEPVQVPATATASSPVTGTVYTPYPFSP